MIVEDAKKYGRFPEEKDADGFDCVRCPNCKKLDSNTNYRDTRGLPLKVIGGMKVGALCANCWNAFLHGMHPEWFEIHVAPETAQKEADELRVRMWKLLGLEPRA